MAFHLGLEQLQSSRPLELLGYALHWSRLAVREAEEFARERGDPETADPGRTPERTSPGQQEPEQEPEQEEGTFLFGRPDGSDHNPHQFLAICCWTRCAVLSLAGWNKHALEIARLAIDSATRSEDYDLVARLRRLVRDVEEDVAEEERDQGDEGEEDD